MTDTAAAPAKLTFVSQLLTSKIFLAQVVALATSIASAAGMHLLDDQVVQQQAIVMLDVGATALLRWWFPTGPVSLFAPVVTPPAQDIPAGHSVIAVPASGGTPQAATVVPLSIGTHTLDVTAQPAGG